MVDMFLVLLTLLVVFLFLFVLVLNHSKIFFIVILGARPLIDLTFNSFLKFEVFGIQLSELVGLLILVSFILIFLNTKSYTDIGKLKKLIYFVAYAFLSFLLVLIIFPHQQFNIINSVSYLTKLTIIPLTILILVSNFGSMEEINKILNSIKYGYIGYLLAVLALYLIDPILLYEKDLWAEGFQDLRFAGGFRTPSKLTAYLCILFPILLINWNMFQKNAGLFLFMFLSILFFLYLSKYRTSQIAIIVFFGAIGFFYKKYSYIGIGALFSIALIAVSTRFQDGIVQIFKLLKILISGDFFNIQDSLFTGRINHWQVLLWDYIQSHPSFQIFGKGAGSAYQIIEFYTGRGWSAHNGYMEVLIEYGLIGLFLYLFFIAHFFLKGVKELHENGSIKIISVIFLSTIVMHLTLCLATNVIVGQFTYNIYFAVIIGIFIVSETTEKNGLVCRSARK